MSIRPFSLATLDPVFRGFFVNEEDQLPRRPTSGELEVATLFRHLGLLVIEGQKKGSMRISKIYEELRLTNAPVLGPNVGKFLYRNQDLIPDELGELLLVFWGEIYRRNSDGKRYVRFLYKRGTRWRWGCRCISQGFWSSRARAVILIER